MKELNWFEKEGWRYDSRNHCWLRDEISNVLENGEKEVGDIERCNHSRKKFDHKELPNSKPFSKINNTLIFNSCKFPLKWHEEMFKK